MKITIVIFLLLYVITLSAHQDQSPDNSIDTTFKKAFPDATNVKWFENQDGFVVHFTINPVQYRLNFNHDAEIEQSIRYYKAAYLPPYILTRLVQKFPVQEVESVTEVQNPNGISYRIRLNDAKKIIELESDGSGKFEVKNIFKKE